MSLDTTLQVVTAALNTGRWPADYKTRGLAVYKLLEEQLTVTSDQLASEESAIENTHDAADNSHSVSP